MIKVPYHMVESVAQVFRLQCLAVASVLLCSCPGPLKKPIPPLNPLKATENQKPAEKSPAAPTSTGQVTSMPVGDLYQLVQGKAAVIYDVRPAIFHRMGHIPSSVSWPETAFDRDLAKHEPRVRAANSQNTPVVIYCTDLACPDAVTVATKLAQRGHDASVLQGGYQAWKDASP